MIQANELRIGNWAMHDGEYGQLKAIHSGEMAFDPIPLTPEILDKCGLKQNGNSTRIGQGYYWSNDDITIVEVGGGWFELFGSECSMGKSFKHLHQLQNLYFALTGEELKIDL